MSRSKKRASKKGRLEKEKKLIVEIPRSDELSQSKDTPSTPITRKTAGLRAFGVTYVPREVRIEDMINEVKNHIAGPMNLGDFLLKFLPNPPRQELDVSKKVKFKRELEVVGASITEEVMYTHFIKALSFIMPNFPGRNTSRTPFLSYQDISIMPDISFFHKSAPTSLQHIEMMAELKLELGDDAFPSGGGSKVTQKGMKTLGQITAYATAHRSSQFRQHLFSLLVFKKHARILFWDCAGVAVTDRFSLTDDMFMEFLRRYNDATMEQRGYDPTVKPLSNAMSQKLYPKGLFQKKAKLVSISIDTEEYMVEQPFWMGTGSPFGRSTRTFIAHRVLKTSTSDFITVLANPVLLKDTWRVLGREKEDVIYKMLKDNQVPFIPTPLQAGDVPGQVSRVQKVAEATSWGPFPPLREFQHYRLVLKEVASDITTFRSTKELVSVLLDALQAHKAAYENAHILHRDISAGNILIDVNRRGLLVDWDLSKDRDERGKVASERTATWQFTSARLLGHRSEKDPGIHSLADDLESFVHVLTWLSFRYTPTNYKPQDLRKFLQNIFDNNLPNPGYATAKGSHLRSRAALWKLPTSPLKELLILLFQVICARYEIPEMDINKSLTPEGREIATADYHNRLGFLKTSEWMINSLQTSLKQPNWPADDGACPNPLEDDPSGQHSEELPQPGPSKKLRLSDI